MPLPPDDHSHSEWSWDAVNGSMEGSCARAVELGLPSIAFTEHVDRARWRITGPLSDPASAAALDAVSQRVAANVSPDGCFDAPPLDVDGYLLRVNEIPIGQLTGEAAPRQYHQRAPVQDTTLGHYRPSQALARPLAGPTRRRRGSRQSGRTAHCWAAASPP